MHVEVIKTRSLDNEIYYAVYRLSGPADSQACFRVSELYRGTSWSGAMMAIAKTFANYSPE